MKPQLLLGAVFLLACADVGDEQELLPTIVKSQNQRLAVANRNDKDLVWPKAQRRSISYCVEMGRPARYGGFGFDTRGVEIAAKAAADAWSAIADVDFDFVETRDCDYCDPRVTLADVECTTAKRVEADFAIIPFEYVDVKTTVNDDGIVKMERHWLPVKGRQNDAQTTFLPGLLVSDDFQGIKVGSELYQIAEPEELAQVMTHEFGHVLGFLHEQNRADVPAGLRGQDCPAEALEGISLKIRGVTAYDRFSVMHYPAVGGFAACGGRTDGKFYELSFMDKIGVPCIYGEPGTGRVPDYCSVLTVMPTTQGAYLAATTTLTYLPFTGFNPGIIVPTF